MNLKTDNNVVGKPKKGGDREEQREMKTKTRAKAKAKRDKEGQERYALSAYNGNSFAAASTAPSR